MKNKIDYATVEMTVLNADFMKGINDLQNKSASITVLGTAFIRRTTLDNLNALFLACHTRNVETFKLKIKDSFNNAKKLGDIQFLELGITDTKTQTLSFKRGIGYSVGTPQKRPVKASDEADKTPEKSNGSTKPQTIEGSPLPAISELDALKAEIEKLKMELSNANDVIVSKIDVINDLNHKLSFAKVQNDALANDNETLSKKLSSEKQAYSELSVRFETLRESKKA